MINKSLVTSLPLSKRMVKCGEWKKEVELWKPIKGYVGLYEISNHGRARLLSGVILKPFKRGRKGAEYWSVDLHKSGAKNKIYYVHRLVAIHFVEKPDNKNDVNHIDGNKENNMSFNLEWVTDRENKLHAYAIGLRSNKGEKNPNSRLTAREVSFIRYIKGLYPIILEQDIADFHGVAIPHVNQILNFKKWKNT